MKKITVLFSALLLTIALLTGCNSSAPSKSSSSGISTHILDDMEGPPKNGHTIQKHVGKSDDELKNRIKSEHVSAASTYYTKDVANKAVVDSLKQNDRKIKQWLEQSGPNRLVIKATHSFAVGKTVVRKNLQIYENVERTLTVLQRDAKSKLHYKIVTSYPIQR
ncbi:hypothetical protein A374_06791 [Fictibacillus macauensis ZFHKF-1]|uniref:Bacterial CdiA-CT RNAse A domain-containing protein n=1 Tax=Fictibacillus macauensis ZFHKF-1 TaxID=1196324 RepID=I8J3E1_9BACL|nr:RNase A-like domain-containing lipoprotein [Fictibacillus macauensis]EIT86286.1 hypothetical protein A374_06791 [Fictibacillus macauensis ZFHKF-1]